MPTPIAIAESATRPRWRSLLRLAIATIALAAVVAWGTDASLAAADSPQSSPVAESGETLRDHWYVLSLDGTPCGRMHRTARREGTSIRSREATEMAVSRDGTDLSIAIELEVVETLEGEPIQAIRRFVSNGQAQTTTWRFGKDAIETIETQGDRERRSTVPRPDRSADLSWLSTAQAEAFAASRREAGAARIELTVLSFDRGLEVLTTVAVRKGDSKLRWQGREIPAVEWEIATEGEATRSRQLWSADGRLLSNRTPTGLGELVATIATEAEASAWRQGALPDVVRATVIPLEGRLPRAGDATLRISMHAGSLPDLPETPRQRVRRIDESSARVVLLGSADDAIKAKTPEASMLAASALLELEDPLLQELARTPRETNPPEVAEALRRLVRGHLRNKDLGVVFASAAEAARSRQGDCSEHATLLCALLRIRGIPARIAVGLGHADRFAGKSNVFAWHAWTQAWIEEQWVDLDATVARPQDGRRVAVAFSDLGKGVFDPVWSEALPLMGAMSIAVEREANQR